MRAIYWTEAKRRNFRLVLPVDHVLAESFDSAATHVTDIASTPEGWMGLDIGPKTIDQFSREISTARTIVWNGPLGMFEKPAFAQGTLAIARAVAAASSNGRYVHCRRRRFRRGRGTVRRRLANFAHLNGRWRFAGISRR